MRTVVLTPWRTDHGPRQKAWDYVRHLIEQTGFESFTGSPSGDEWNMALALRDAAEKAGEWDQAIIWDADMVIDPARVEAIGRVNRMTVLYDRVIRLSAPGSKAFMRGAPLSECPTLHVYEKPGWVPSGGLYVLPDWIWEKTGGVDPRFTGWGCEDTAFVYSVKILCGRPDRIRGDAIALWHPRAKRNDPSYPANLELLERYQAARTPEAVSNLIDEWRLNGHYFS